MVPGAAIPEHILLWGWEDGARVHVVVTRVASMSYPSTSANLADLRTPTTYMSVTSY